MGMIGGLLVIPFNAIVAWYLKRDELAYQHHLNDIARRRELLLKHKLQLSLLNTESNNLDQVKNTIFVIRDKLYRVETIEIKEINGKIHDINETLRRQSIVIKNLHDTANK